MPPGFLLNLSAPQSERFASPSVFRHFGSMKSKHPGGRVAVLCWCFTSHSRYVNKAKVLEGKQPNGWTPATGTHCNAARGRRHNDWIIEEFSTAMWHCCVSQRCRCEETASIKLKRAAGRWGYRQSSPLWKVPSTQRGGGGVGCKCCGGCSISIKQNTIFGDIGTLIMWNI